MDIGSQAIQLDVSLDAVLVEFTPVQLRQSLFQSQVL